MPADQPADFEVLASNRVFEGMIWDVVREEFEFGTERLTREFVDHPGAVAVVAINEKLEVLLLQQYRHPVREYLWEIPAGLRDVPGESAESAAKRELLEETGYHAQTLEPLISFHTTPGGNNETIQIFLAQGLKFVGHDIQLIGEEKDMPVSWVPLDDCVTAILNSKVRSPSAAVGIMALALKRQRG